ncbi:hypothetical protein [Candidatus Deianiraea vastatrix]|uniref:Uncharacterized protein n=1 Tax=Candidatus Deianiraea vastatrix TaxID=2163644 RepID=A0A5B8XCF2_9RICK|nr:hypothetical protein [Candidatus Deianiraea vastatrix]QED22993.1 hypothetical protein Deia_00185 [Candidatus Deianiraea vastatrix]
MKAITIDIIQKIQRIEEKRKEAEQLINNQFIRSKFELLCKELSSDIYTILFEYIESIPNIIKKQGQKIKLEFLSNKCCYDVKSKEISVLHKKITGNFFLKVHENHIKYADYLDEMIAIHKKMNLFIPQYISILPYEKRQKQYTLLPTVGVVNKFDVVSLRIAQPLIITSDKGSPIIYNAKYSDSRRQFLEKDKFLNLQSFYSKDILKPIYKKSKYQEWLNNETIFNYSGFYTIQYVNDTNNIIGLIEHLSRKDIILVLRNKFGGVHRSDISKSFDQQKIDLLFTIFGEERIMQSLYISILSIAYEIEYSWKNYISPILSKIEL